MQLIIVISYVYITANGQRECWKKIVFQHWQRLDRLNKGLESSTNDNAQNRKSEGVKT